MTNNTFECYNPDQQGNVINAVVKFYKTTDKAQTVLLDAHKLPFDHKRYNNTTKDRYIILDLCFKPLIDKDIECINKWTFGNKKEAISFFDNLVKLTNSLIN